MNTLQGLLHNSSIPSQRDTLTQFIFVPDNVLQADATIVLGMSLWERPLARAIELYRQGLAGKLVLCGGYNLKIDAIEALQMYRKAKSIGIPNSDMLVDPDSSNTAENFSTAALLLQANNIEITRSVVNIVSIHFHSRRALLTAQQVFGKDIQFGIATYPSVHYTSKTWYETETGHRNVCDEIEKITRYFPENRLPEGIN
ncbi:MAG: DUF218 domain-containing protein [Candidatus Nitrotoga sp. SPKER]|nr:MAG: DUF218 domain-containing protein [Candidatus Nitrotoga sp. SPKER]